MAGELTSVGGASYSYDQAGNLIVAGSDSFAWDDASRLTSAEIGDHSATYTYDGDGIRVGATVDGVDASFLLDREGGLPSVVGDGTSRYLHAHGVLEGVSGSQPSFPLGDRLDSVRGMTDDSGTLVGSTSYDAFGAPRAVSGLDGLFGFTGEPTDATGLVDLRARTYDPATGRMLSADTLIPNAPGTQGYSVYAYVANDPTTWTDPTGHLAGSPFLGPWIVATLFTAGVESAVESMLLVLGVVTGTSPWFVPVLALVLAGIWILVFLMDGSAQPLVDS